MAPWGTGAAVVGRRRRRGARACRKIPTRRPRQLGWGLIQLVSLSRKWVVLSGGFKTLLGMAQNFLSCDRDQVLLLPVDLGEWLPAGHVARFVIETVDQLDLSGIYGYYRQDGRGRPAHDPAMMVALVLYAYAVGVTSSRAIERRCVEDVAFRVITVNRQPDHATIARFLVRHREAVQGLFFDVLALCQRAGMVRMGTVAVDSTKLAANASADQNRTYDGLRREAQRIIEEAIETDRREDELYGEKRGDELPEELADPGTRTQRIRELLEQAKREREEIEADRAEVQARHDEHLARTGKRINGRPPRATPSQDQQRMLEHRKYNLTDPDSRIVRHRGMLMQGYNVQTVVADGQVIVSARVTGSANDQGQLGPAIEQATAHLARIGCEEPIGEVLADSGYWSIRQVTTLQRAHARVLVPPVTGNAKTPDRLHPVARSMLATLETEDGKAAYRRRQAIVEPVFAQVKHNRGITRLLRRGRAAVQAEIDLIATTHNLLKLRTALQTV
jgi:transposase